MPFEALDSFCDPGNNSLGKSTGREMRWQGCVSEKDLASGSGIVGESAEKGGKKRELNTNTSLKYIKTESLLFFFLVNTPPVSSCMYGGCHKNQTSFPPLPNQSLAKIENKSPNLLCLWLCLSSAPEAMQ